LVAEKTDTVPLGKKGWQDALEAAYPFKINRFTFDDGDVVYIHDAVNPPFHRANLNFTSDNIRNIHAANNVYPSRLHATLVIFGTGRPTIDSHCCDERTEFPEAGSKAQRRCPEMQ
jgi:hypothetical protein